MGRVDLASKQRDRFNRFYAIKHLHPHLVRDPSARAMFTEESRIAGMLSHPNVVGVLDVGEDSDGPYIVMDFVEGVTLARLQSIADDLGEALPLQVCVRIALFVARGLDAIHRASSATGQPLGLVHRDLSPKNILVGFDGSVRITDFGIAKAKGRTIQTTVGLLKGTPGYLSPERLRFEDPEPRSDLFSLGVVLYELLAGERLYSGSDEAAVREILVEPPPDIGELRPETPAALTNLLFHMLAKDPAQRPESASAVALQLESILHEVSSLEEPVNLGMYVSALGAEKRTQFRERLNRAIDAREVTTFMVGRRRRRWLAPTLLAGFIAAAAALGLVFVPPLLRAGDGQESRDLMPTLAPPTGLGEGLNGGPSVVTVVPEETLPEENQEEGEDHEELALGADSEEASSGETSSGEKSS
ncbi:MAG: serine/threonine-protein kinase, partial [Myxococcota bacterium]